MLQRCGMCICAQYPILTDPAMTLFPLMLMQTINVTENESDNFYHYHDNRVMPSHVDAKLADAEGDSLFSQIQKRQELLSECHCRNWVNMLASLASAGRRQVMQDCVRQRHVCM
jgi:hypothetical protein